MDSQLTEMWRIQRQYAEKFADFEKMTEEGRQKLTRDYVLHSIEELMEMTRYLHWKVHRKSDANPTKGNILEEVTDTYKYLIDICLAWGITPQEFYDSFIRKSEVCDQRWRQEFEKPYDPARYRGLVVVDIDGVLADYVPAFMAYARANSERAIPDYTGVSGDMDDHLALYIGAKELQALKHRYREDGGKLSIPPMGEACSLMRMLASEGLYIALLTARPYKRYRRIMSDTIRWLEANEIRYHAIFWDPAKYTRVPEDFPDLVAAFEDQPKHALPMAERGVRVFMPLHPYNSKIGHANIRPYSRSEFMDVAQEVVNLIPEKVRR